MSRTVDKMQLFCEDDRQRVKVRLLSWPELHRKIQRYEQDRKTLRQLDEQIVSSVPRYENLDMPRSTSVSDKVGHLAVRIADKRMNFTISSL